MNGLTQDLTGERLLVIMGLCSMLGVLSAMVAMRMRGWRPPLKKGKGPLKLPCHGWLAVVPMGFEWQVVKVVAVFITVCWLVWVAVCFCFAVAERRRLARIYREIETAFKAEVEEAERSAEKLPCHVWPVLGVMVAAGEVSLLQVGVLFGGLFGVTMLGTWVVTGERRAAVKKAKAGTHHSESDEYFRGGDPHL